MTKNETCIKCSEPAMAQLGKIGDSQLKPYCYIHGMEFIHSLPDDESVAQAPARELIYEEIWRRGLQVEPLPFQVDICVRTLRGSVQAFVPRQAGSTTVILASVIRALTRGKSVCWVSPTYRDHRPIAKKTTDALNHLSIDYSIGHETTTVDGEVIPHNYDLTLPVYGSTLSIRPMHLLSYDINCTDSPAHSPITFGSARTQVWEVGPGFRTVWDPNPIYVNLNEVPILNWNIINEIQMSIPEPKFREEFGPWDQPL